MRSQQFEHRFIGLAGGRRRCCSDQQRAVFDADDLIVFCTWLNAQRQHVVVAVAPRKRVNRCGYRPNGLNPLTTMVAASSRIMARIGERSNPPIGGRSRRKGRNTGSVSVVIIAVAGL